MPLPPTSLTSITKPSFSILATTTKWFLQKLLFANGLNKKQNLKKRKSVSFVNSLQGLVQELAQAKFSRVCAKSIAYNLKNSKSPIFNAPTSDLFPPKKHLERLF